MDTILPPRVPTWDEVREQALERYRLEGGDRAMRAKRAELDSLAARGVSFDSLSVLMGGPAHVDNATSASDIPGIVRSGTLDTLLFRHEGPGALALGEATNWIEFPSGFVRLRLLARTPAPHAEVEARLQSQARLVLQRGLQKEFDALKERYPVRILDAELRAIPLPQPPGS
jgi:hypothetical protein